MTERLTRISPTQIRYEFTVEDPDVYKRPWRAELMLTAAKGPIYEFACHEGNYAFPDILAGARATEKAAKAEPAKAEVARAIAEISRSALPGDGAIPASDEQLADAEMRVALAEAVAKLPPALSEVFHLRVSGLRYEEIADVLECPVGTIKSRMNQMVNKLREELRPWTVG